MTLSVTVIRETVDAQGEIVRVDTSTEDYTAGELVGLLQYELFCGCPSQWPIDMSAGSDLTDVWLTQVDEDGDRECIEKGYVKRFSIHYERGQPERNVKYWRKMFEMLEREDRIIH